MRKYETHKQCARALYVHYVYMQKHVHWAQRRGLKNTMEMSEEHNYCAWEVRARAQHSTGNKILKILKSICFYFLWFIYSDKEGTLIGDD